MARGTILSTEGLLRKRDYGRDMEKVLCVVGGVGLQSEHKLSVQASWVSWT